MSDKTIAIITLVYKNYSILADFFSSLQKQTDTAFHLYVADASPSPQNITTSFPSTVLHVPNKGYSHGINRCIEKAQRDEVALYVVMNNDVLFESDFIGCIRTSIQRHPASLIGGKIYYAKGYEFHIDHYQKDELGNVIWYAGASVDWAHALTHHLGVDDVDHGQYDTETNTECVTGCLSIFDQTLLEKVGMWDESFFLYYEDADFSVRAQKKQCPVIYDPSIKLWHKNAQSTGGSGSTLHEKLQQRSRLRFAWKHAPWRTKLHLLKNTYL